MPRQKPDRFVTGVRRDAGVPTQVAALINAHSDG